MNGLGVAYAMGIGGTGAGDAAGGGLAAFVPLLLMVGIFYFLLIRPQQKKQKDHQSMLAALKKGDRIITQGGIHGTIANLSDTMATIEIAEKVRVKIQRGYIAGILAKGEATE
ncbi:MAG: preprotein translocase subunit YajC [Syntrophobacteraceae bacterium CG07_land_8_20_14_0_80_61_8]|nr:MAG: preprotein translocase subunit YajC [Syntrophobacteraceae bacterium CG07_land_8_20_14_0_80_61_8]